MEPSHQASPDTALQFPVGRSRCQVLSLTAQDQSLSAPTYHTKPFNKYCKMHSTKESPSHISSPNAQASDRKTHENQSEQIHHHRGTLIEHLSRAYFTLQTPAPLDAVPASAYIPEENPPIRPVETAHQRCWTSSSIGLRRACRSLGPS